MPNALRLALLLALTGCTPASEPLDAAGTDAPGTDAAGIDAPGIDAPSPLLDAPGTDAPGIDAPGTDAPVLADAGCVPIDPGPPTDPEPVMTTGAITACPVETTLVDGWCVPRLEVGPLVTITVPTYEPCAAPPVIAADRSVLVTDHTLFSAVEADLSLGRLLTDRNAFMNAYIYNHHLEVDAMGRDLGRVHSRRAGTFQPFSGGRTQVTQNNEWTGAHLGSVFEIRNSWNEWIIGPFDGGTGLWDDTGSATELSDPDGPFRLLAVANRMDLAGEIDGRQLGLPGSTLAEDLRKWFGEGRLVFGLTDGGDGARPMTFIVEYRLPALREVARDATSVTYAVAPPCSGQVTGGCFDHTLGPASNEDWIEGRARWARVWRELSGSHSDAEYRARLRDIVRLFARPENFIALRSGEHVRDAPGGPDDSGIDEFEYREFYSNDGFGLARRHNRREALFCAGGSQLLRDVIVDEYDPTLTFPNHGYALGDRLFRERDRGDGGARFRALDALCGGAFDSSEAAGEIQLRPAFARFEPDQLWPALPTWNSRRGANDDAATTEGYRHVMALNTCSGCHSAETGTHGFHIAPRTADADSVLSPFLDGTDHTVSLDVGGTTYEYTYNELARRSDLLESFYEHVDVGSETPHRSFEDGLLQAMLTCTTSPCGTP